MDASIVLVEEDVDEDHGAFVAASDESERTSTPLSFQTFGGHPSPGIGIGIGNHASPPSNDVDLLHIPEKMDPTRPSLDSFQSSSPSTAPPSTPTRAEGIDHGMAGSTSTPPRLPTSPTTSDPTPSSPSPCLPGAKPRTAQGRREFRIYGLNGNEEDDLHVSQSSRHAPPVEVRIVDEDPMQPTAADAPRDSLDSGDGDTEPQKAGGTLRRTKPSKLKPRPRLGVSTFASGSTSATVEASPLSPVIGSPRSNHTGGMPQTPSISYIPHSGSVEALVPCLPMSPDVTLDITPSQSMTMPDGSTLLTPALVSPFGTTLIKEPKSTPEPKTNSAQSEKAREKGGSKLQYKPRKRVPTPRKNYEQASEERSSFSSGFGPLDTRRNTAGTVTSVRHRDDAPKLRQDPTEVPDSPVAQPRTSFSKWTFSNPDGGLGKGMMRRLSRLRSNSDLQTYQIGAPTAKSAVDVPSNAFDSIPKRHNSENRGSVSDGPFGRRRSSGLAGSGMGVRLSKILPFPSSKRRSSQKGVAESTIVAEPENIDDGSAHLWATAQSYVASPPRPTRISVTGTGSNDGHRRSTITVRSNDGWFTTVPASSLSLSPNNASPIRTSFATGGGESHNDSPHDPSPEIFSSTPPSAFSHGPLHSVSDPTTPTLATLAAANANALPGSTSSSPTVASPLVRQHGSVNSVATQRARPQSLQYTLPRTGSTSSAQAKTELLAGIPHGPDSVRLLDVETAAAIRRSIDFEDRVRKGENVLRRALYGSETTSSPPTPGASASSRSSSFSAAANARGRGNFKHGGKGLTERSLSLTMGAGYPASGSGTNSPRSGSVDHARGTRDGLSTGGGVFLPNAGATSQRHRYSRMNGSFHSNSSSGLSTPLHMAPPSQSATNTLRNRTIDYSPTASGALREDREEAFISFAEDGKLQSRGISRLSNSYGGSHHDSGSTLAKRVGRRISRIFVGKGTVAP